ncbi:hypothetical protein [Streptomyces fuscichromogenes]|uniref:Integral membrane protein n=1 Tax=Streptomyces fuscichromogenes TaxID=1324013 RepID=A0A918CTX6_9ACTN|nr:hypothetical protein [Streptomyces fuscichromogenes]GGN24349.1 hypothetical protein GCM10011578_057450 [Streptomyces fuscichromogenes]
MPDRSLGLRMLPPQSVQGGTRAAVLLRERPASPPDAPSDRPEGDQQDDNPFAPPPEGTPDTPWRPRRPTGDEDRGAPWGSQWSDRQPGRQAGGFGERPGDGGPGDGGQGGPGGPGGPGMRWDPTDPAQRRARYALLCGMWAFLFALFSWPYVALLLGALAVYWGVSALRAKPRTPEEAATGRPQTTAAISGLVTASLALALVAANFTAQMVYRDYYTCVTDALTNEAQQSCDHLLPKELRGVLGSGNS